MMKRIRLFMLACGLSLGAIQAGAVSLQSQLLSDCTTVHVNNSGNPAVLAEIEARCSASNPAVGVVMSEWNYDHIRAHEHYLEFNQRVTFSFSSLYPGSSIRAKSGRSAGGQFDNIGVWITATGGFTDNNFARTPFENTSRGVQMGVDFTPTEFSLLGISLGYSNEETRTPFNGGALDMDTVTGMLYGAMGLGEIFSVDAVLGYSDINTDETRLAAGVAGFSSDPFRSLAFGTPISGEVDTQRWFGAINLNAFRTVRHLVLAGRVGYLYSDTDQDSFTETGGGISATAPGETYVLSQWHVGATVGYDFGSFLEPYAGLDYSYDMSRETVRTAPGLPQPANDRSEMMIRLGMRYFGDNGISAALEWNTNALRQDIDRNSLLLTLRLDL